MIKTIGVTGGAGSGKSEVLKILSEHFNAHVIMADEVARHLSQKGEKSYIKVVEAFGETILDENGEIDRQKLAMVIFDKPEKRALLNQLTHPDVQEAILNEIAAVRAEGRVSCIVVEAALLIEAGYKELLDELWFVYTDVDIRRERMKVTRGYSDEKIDGILKSQLPDQVFIRECDRVITNNTSLKAVEEQLQKIFDEDIHHLR